MTMSQMNVRIDEDLRKEGNLALEGIGFSPSRIVRDIWSYAARHRDNPLKLKQALQFLDEDQNPSSKRTDCSSKVKLGWDIVSNGLADLDISLSNAEPLPYDELKERAYREHWEEKGLL